MSFGKVPHDEETVLQSLFANFSNLGFDKAKDQADKERDLCRNTGTSLWIGFLNLVSQLALAEKLNMNLGFLATKSFLRKENSVRATYQALLNELTELEKKHTPIFDKRYNDVIASCSLTDDTSPDRTFPGFSPAYDGVLLHLSSHLITYCQARIQLISFYEYLISISSNNWMEFDQLNEDVGSISHKSSKLFHHPVLIPLKTNYNFECDILSHLLGCIKEMKNWQFFSSLLHLDGAQTKLASWHTILTSKETKKLGFLKSSPLPPLYLWLVSAKSSLVSKFSLYFYETLMAQSSPHEMKSLLSKQSNDYISKIQTFQKKSDARSVCLVLDTSQIEGYKGHGYHCPDKVTQPLTGIDAFPAVFSYPSQPTEYWGTIVSKIIEYKQDFLTTDKVGYFYDQKIGISCFYCQSDLTMTFLAVYSSYKSEKDNYIRDFVNDTARQLRCVKIFASLKPK